MILLISQHLGKNLKSDSIMENAGNELKHCPNIQIKEKKTR